MENEHNPTMADAVSSWVHRPNNREIARSLNLWNTYFNTSALMDDDQFEAMTVGERLRMLTEAFGPDGSEG